MPPHPARPARAALAAAAAVLALAAAGCGDDGPAATTAATPSGSGGTTIPPTTTATPAPAPVVTTPDGAPKVVQFAAPERFWCLPAKPGQAQATIGWSVPSATKVTVLLDGKALPEGIRDDLPFSVPAGPPSGIGATIVFPCRPATRHRVTIRWRMGSSPVATRTVTIAKAKGKSA